MQLKYLFIALILPIAACSKSFDLMTESKSTACINCGCLEAVSTELKKLNDVELKTDIGTMAPLLSGQFKKCILSQSSFRQQHVISRNAINRYTSAITQIDRTRVDSMFSNQIMKINAEEITHCATDQVDSGNPGDFLDYTKTLIRRCQEDQAAVENLMQTLDSGVANDAEGRVSLQILSLVSLIIRLENSAYMQQTNFSEKIKMGLLDDDESARIAAYYLMQHSEAFPELQEMSLKAMEDRVKKGAKELRPLIPPLADRLMIGKIKKQIYGTHTVCEGNQARLSYPTVLEGKELDKKRQEMGLKPLGEFLREVEC